jgi:hypothetical protein
MDVSMNKIPGLITGHQGIENLKAGVSQIVSVVEVKGGGMSEQNIKPALSHEVPGAQKRPAIHLPLGILVLSQLLIAHGAAQTKNADALVGVDLIFHTDTALRRDGGISVVVIPMDIQQRRVGEGDDEGQIPRIQVTAGEDKIDSFQPLPVKVIP